MTFRLRYLLATVLGLATLWMSHPLLGADPAAPARLPLEPGREPAQGLTALPSSSNQTVATRIAERLASSGQLRRYNVNVVFQDGTAQLSGTVSELGQRDAAVRLASEVTGVERVVDRLAIAPVTITQAQASSAPPAPEVAPVPRKEPPPAGAKPMDPMPIFQAPPIPYDLNPPKMPPYAWPTYAPYNNYSRVAYPNLYPYESWPFIGPCHPFPKIPLGWRSVKLTWHDGYWWYGKNASGHDWWRLRYY